MRNIFFIAMMAITVPSLGQSKFLVETGITQSDFWYNKRMMNDAGTDSRTSFYISSGIQTKIFKKLYWQNTIGFLSRRYYYHFFIGPDNGGHLTYLHQSVTLQTILCRQLPISETINFLPGAGVYIAAGTGGRVNYEYDFNALQIGSRKLNIGNNSSDDFKRFETGLIIQTPFQFKSFFISPSFNFSITNGNNKNAKQTWKFSKIGFGYVF